MKLIKMIGTVGLAAVLWVTATAGAETAEAGHQTPVGNRMPVELTGAILGAPPQDWQPHGCNITVKDGVLSVAGNARSPFLSLQLDKLDAPATLRFRLKCDGGRGKAAWIEDLAAKLGKPSKTGEFMVKAGDWTEMKTKIVAPKNRAGFVVLNLPLPAEVDWIELTAAGKTHRWEFDQNRAVWR